MSKWYFSGILVESWEDLRRIFGGSNTILGGSEDKSKSTKTDFQKTTILGES